MTDLVPTDLEPLDFAPTDPTVAADATPLDPRRLVADCVVWLVRDPPPQAATATAIALTTEIETLARPITAAILWCPS